MQNDVLTNYLNTLSTEEKKNLIAELTRDVRKTETDKKLTESCINNSNCPHCQGNHIVKIGKVNGIQRFKCRNCGKNFSLKTNTAFAYSKKSIEIWHAYIELMSDKLSIRKIAERLKINKNTALLWRHKILSVISFAKSDKLCGIVEADEVYFRESQKGNHKLARKSHKHGKSRMTKQHWIAFAGLSEEEYTKMKRKRGLSQDQVCIITALDRTNNILGKAVGFGKVKPQWIEQELQPFVSKKSILVTDGEKGYSRIKSVKHKKFITGMSKSKTYNLGRVDNLHTSMKGLINGTFKGVATKYLSNYVNYVKILKQNTDLFTTIISNNVKITRDTLRSQYAF